jgi:hypothetical protein
MIPSRIVVHLQYSGHDTRGPELLPGKRFSLCARWVSPIELTTRLDDVSCEHCLAKIRAADAPESESRWAADPAAPLARSLSTRRRSPADD